MLSFSAACDDSDIFDACAAPEAPDFLFRGAFPGILWDDERDERLLQGASSDSLATKAQAGAVLEGSGLFTEEP